ncbi:hypothetical protein [Jiangella anatolica]|uniref:Uncharacterized protein n=1 Tax=Jiangella anatolica TaxID=2670374 RepID=A0A2W2C4T9_9ACTN|nr:hypothetical protein [Jiangella anatolica]PZF83219.1 hypothetical protein C1I92_13155 [Jiangella anatolica]
MTVSELIEALLNVEDRSAVVLIEGCDCIGTVLDVNEGYGPGEVLIQREAATQPNFDRLRAD